MASLAAILRDLLERDQPSVLATVTRVSGSTPREAGASMVVSQELAAGTIGGGRLEWLAIEQARDMIASGEAEAWREVPLGPAVGQCCGGKVEITFRHANRDTLAELEAAEQQRCGRRPQVMIFGAGHVGTQIGRALALLPFETTLVDDRAERLQDLPGKLRTLPTADPVAEVRSAPPEAAAIVLTYSHSLDFEITEAALRRGDLTYVGLIGSKTKRTRFERWFLARGGSEDELRPLVCPIGGNQVPDKRPEVIAALVAAELVMSLLNSGQLVLSEERDYPAVASLGVGR